MNLPPHSRLITLTTALSISLGCTGLLGDREEESSPPLHTPSTAPASPLPQPTAAVAPAARVVLQPDGSCLEEGGTSPTPVDCPPLRVVSFSHPSVEAPCGQDLDFTRCPEGMTCVADAAVVLAVCPPELEGVVGTLSKHPIYGCVLEDPAGSRRPLACPPELAEKRPNPSFRYVPQSGGLCLAFPTAGGDCPPGVRCNPPPPQKVVCPPSTEGGDAGP